MTSRLLTLRTWAPLLGLLSVTVFAAPVRYDIPGQPAPAALQQFRQQSKAQVTFNESELKDVRANPVRGEYEASAALKLLLQGTGYSGDERKPGWFLIISENVSRLGVIEGNIREEKSGKPVANASVQIFGSDKIVTSDKRGRFILEGVAAGGHVLLIAAEGMQNTKVTDVEVREGGRLSLSPIGMPVKQEGPLQLEPYSVSAKKNDSVLELDPYAVSGTKQQPFVNGNLDIPRTADDAQPYYIFDSRTIENSGAVNVEDFLKQRLTMNTTALTESQDAASDFGNTSRINLRGIGADKTLILVNGRRLAGITIGSDSYQPDLNGIPPGAIDRIEVMPTSASGIYGGSAIGGVVNVILKRDYSGGEARVSYDNTLDSDSPRRYASFSYGRSLEGGRSHILMSVSWAHQETLLLQDRGDVFREKVREIDQNSPTYLSSSSTPFLGSLPNITPNSTTAATLILKSGNVSLNSRNTYVAAGTSNGTSAATLNAGLLANAGRWNIELPLSTQSPTGLLRPFGSTPEVRSFRASFRRQMVPWLELSADLSWSENRTVSVYNALSSFLTVRAAAPTNPFTADVRIRIPDAGQFPFTTRSTNRNATVSALAQLPGRWTGILDYSWSENRFNRFNYTQDTTARTADLLSGVLNPFVDTLQYPLDLARYQSSRTYEGATRITEISLRGSGPFFSLPWGEPTLAGSLEHNAGYTPERSVGMDFPISRASSYIAKFYRRDTAKNSGYLEAKIPLIKSRAFPGLYSLDLQVAGRHEAYRTDVGTPYAQTFYNTTPVQVSYAAPTVNGQPIFEKATYRSTDYTIGLKYQPINQLTLRVSKSTAFLPPMGTQLSKDPAVLSPGDIVNGAPVDIISGGNPDLKPQNSKSFNAGLIWEPIKGLRLNAEYYKIEQFDAIGSLTAQQIVNSEGSFPGRVTRNSDGAITLVDTSLMNLYRRETEGWDLNVDYSIRTSWGQLSILAVESIIVHLRDQFNPQLAEFDAAGHHPADGGSVKNKRNVTVNWQRNRWSAGWTTRYFSSYHQWGSAGGPSSVQFSNGGVYLPTYIAAQGSDTIPSQIYHDAFVGYSFDKNGSDKIATLNNKILSGMSVQLGVRNVFNTIPPLDAYFAGNYYLSPYGDVRLQSYWVTVKKQF